jgi:hypothetical protein
MRSGGRLGPVLSAAVSVDVFVFLKRESLPSTAAWQGAVDRLGIDVQLDASIEVASHSGYWPARLGGQPSGFEILVGPIPDVFGRAAPPGLDERNIAVDFVTGSDMRELQCSMFAAAALGIETDGLIFDDDSEGLMQPSELLEQARAIDLS